MERIPSTTRPYPREFGPQTQEGASESPAPSEVRMRTNSARGGTRTHTSLRTAGFKPAAYDQFRHPGARATSYARHPRPPAGEMRAPRPFIGRRRRVASLGASNFSAVRLFYGRQDPSRVEAS